MYGIETGITQYGIETGGVCSTETGVNMYGMETGVSIVSAYVWNGDNYRYRGYGLETDQE